MFSWRNRKKYVLVDERQTKEENAAEYLEL